MDSTRSAFDPRTEQFALHANDQFSKMRKEAPIWTETFDNQTIHHVFSYREAAKALKTWDTWSSRIELFDKLLLKDASILIQDDPPRHNAVKRAIAPWLKERTRSVQLAVPAIIRNRFSQLAEDVVDGVALGVKIKDEVIKVLLGVNDDQLRELNEWGSAFAEGIGLEFLVFSGSAIEQQKRFVTNAHATLDKIVDKVLSSQTDQISQYNARVTSQLGESDSRSLFKSLVFASNHTLSTQLTNFFYCAARYPDLLIAQTGASTEAIGDEVLRFKGVFRGSHRKLIKHTELSGFPMNPGDYCVIWTTSANHDESVFPQGMTFSPLVERTSRHLSFGAGIHRCVGAEVSQFTLNSVVEELKGRGISMSILTSKPLKDPWVDGCAELTLDVRI